MAVIAPPGMARWMSKPGPRRVRRGARDRGNDPRQHAPSPCDREFHHHHKRVTSAATFHGPSAISGVLRWHARQTAILAEHDWTPADITALGDEPFTRLADRRSEQILTVAVILAEQTPLPAAQILLWLPVLLPVDDPRLTHTAATAYWLHTQSEYDNNLHSALAEAVNRYTGATQADHRIARAAFSTMMAPDELADLYDTDRAGVCLLLALAG